MMQNSQSKVDQKKVSIQRGTNLFKLNILSAINTTRLDILIIYIYTPIVNFD